MDWWMWLLIVGFAVLVLVGVALPYLRRNRLRSQFGPEYDRTVETKESRRDAEHALRARLKAHRKLELRPLPPEAAAEYSDRWGEIQAKFVDAPVGTCREAETLLDEVLRARGYPVDEDFATQADLVSVDHPNLVQSYRAAHDAHHGGPSRTEDLRGAFIAYRGVFAVVLDDQAGAESARNGDETPVGEREVQDEEPVRAREER